MHRISFSSDSRVLQSTQCNVLKLLKICLLQGYQLKKRKIFRLNQSQEEFMKFAFYFQLFCVCNDLHN